MAGNVNKNTAQVNTENANKHMMTQTASNAVVKQLKNNMNANSAKLKNIFSGE